MKGMLVCFEGIDGAGKMTQAAMFKKTLENNGVKTLSISYPDYNSDYGKMIDQYLHGHLKIGLTEFFLLQIADKVKDIAKVKDAIKNGTVVIMDRYYYSTLAFQCAAGFDYTKATTIAEMMDFTKPSLIFYLDIPPSLCYERKMKQKGTVDRHEKNVKYQEDVKSMYDKLLAEKYSAAEWCRVDGSKSVEDVHAAVMSKLKDSGVKIL